MAVLIVPSWYSVGATEQLGAFFREQALALLHSGQEVIVADATLQGRGDYSQNKNFKLMHFNDEGLDTYSLTMPSFGLWRLPELCEFFFLKNLEQVYKRILLDGKKIDIIHAHSYFPAGCAAARLGKKYNIPVIVTEHSSLIIAKKLNNKQIKLLNECVNSATRIIAVSHALKKSMENYTSVPIEINVIPNMVDGKFVPYPHNKQSKEFCFISVGNLVASKRFELTIQAFAACFRGRSDVTLKIIGNGLMMSELQKLVEALQISTQVTFTGRLSRREVARELQKSHIFVLPSDYETFGVAYIEAMACGLPVIGTCNGGADDIITEENGYLIPTNDLAALERAMLDCYHQYASFNKEQIVIDCNRRFGEESVVKQIVKLYSQVR